ncbi:hypothetical protein [Sediminicola sp. YIK13]|uniref:hypothetical protein n=1 Tax=Sediminicola sp. YIK13 TaxID=1453352 RepID=UPI0011AAF18F|nr:hypothetical protein [Sediminicola sp. YIK13]
MKKLILIVTSIFLMSNLSGQECEYEEYFRLTDLAKKEFSEQNFNGAKRNFQLAFAKTDIPLGHDLSYALVTANETKDNEWAEHVAEKLAKGGTPLRYFAKFKKKKWYNKFKSNFELHAKYYVDHFNIEMRNRFLEISQDDYEFTNKYHQWRERKIELTLQELIDGATKILTDFKDFNEKYGFPNEQHMGYNYVRHKNRIEPYHVDVIMIHSNQWGVLTYEDKIHDLVCTGGIHPSFEKSLKGIRGYGNSTGVEQEMQARYAKYRGTK